MFRLGYHITRSNFHEAKQLHRLLSYRSSQNLYPTSSIIDGQKEALNEIKSSQEKFTGFIPIKEISISQCRASGPGGQHVNKINSKVEIRFHVESASWIPDDVKPVFLEREYNRITKDGNFIISSDKTRAATLNQADCMDRIRAAVREAIKSMEPSPGPTEEEKAKMEARRKRKEKLRIQQKRFKSDIRSSRGSV